MHIDLIQTELIMLTIGMHHLCCFTLVKSTLDVFEQTQADFDVHSPGVIIFVTKTLDINYFCSLLVAFQSTSRARPSGHFPNPIFALSAKVHVEFRSARGTT